MLVGSIPAGVVMRVDVGVENECDLYVVCSVRKCVRLINVQAAPYVAAMICLYV